MNSLKKSNDRRVPLFLPPGVLFALLLSVQSTALSLQPFGDNTAFSVSGRNEFRFADGYDNTHAVPKPWNYLINSTDFSITAAKLYIKSRFDVEEPSAGFNPAEPVHREYFSRRTLGLQLDNITIEAGHVGTQFGRGLTLSCKEDREIEQYSLIDGIYGNFRNSFITLQGIAGRPYQLRNRTRSLLSYSNLFWGGPDTILVQNTPDLRQRDMISGIHSEFFLPFETFSIPVITSGSLSGGIVGFSSNVKALASDYHDTAQTGQFWYQPRQEFRLPSAAVNIAAGDFGFSVENSWLSGSEYRLSTSTDPSIGTYEAVDELPVSRATYISANGTIGNLSLLAEYKSYLYAHSEVSLESIDGYFIPPAVRYQHTWHLLNKHMLSNLMGNELAYNVLLNWSPYENALFTVNATFGGRHELADKQTFKPEEPYWEAYTEWQQDIGERLSVKAGFDYGKIDPDPPNGDVTFRTLAGMIEAGPFYADHSFKFILENQLNSKPILAEESINHLKQLIIDILNPDTTTSDNWVEINESLLPASERNTHMQYTFNILTTLEYSFRDWFTISFTFEHEALPEDREHVTIISAITSKQHDYASVGLRVKPIDGTTVTTEYGSMSGGKKCTLGTCVDLPPFEGFKLTIESVF